MPEVSAGILAWRRTASGPEVLLVHPGGPWWRGKDAAAWSIPKGLVEPGEDLLAAALRETAEELGRPLDPVAAPEPLAPVRTPGGKRICAFLVEADFDPTGLASNAFEMEWPPRSGRRASFPEVDQAAWFGPDAARVRIHRGQLALLEDGLRRLPPPG
ncbi:NUDIX domain-containing protein [Phenylobacterium sp. J367]|uniref:NUDIX domain-containing protein n=1 Tax=Phenylobacterium sp. J367 TaxID=2898435 RepID=UPI0021515B66|nr:NUDIX domain-containing protein [Phenylobacterium sp. J367]MCR5878716.1 NUDIX domain-containing protein [Phenylobacterium sp. J367]